MDRHVDHCVDRGKRPTSKCAYLRASSLKHEKYEIYKVWTFISGESVPSPFPPNGGHQIPTGQTPTNTHQQTPQGPPPAYPSLTPLSSHLPLHHALLQQQLLQNPQFVQANANANAATYNTGKSFVSFVLVVVT